MERFSFDTKEEFIAKLEELVSSGVSTRNIDTCTPYHVHEAEHILHEPASNVRIFTAVGAVLGTITGYWFTIFTTLYWPSPMITGGKPLVSIPAYTVIAYELTILFGVLITFLGFLHFTRMPAIADIFSRDREFGEKFEIAVCDEPRK
jgi:hypothetical protein